MRLNAIAPAMDLEPTIILLFFPKYDIIHGINTKVTGFFRVKYAVVGTRQN